MNSRQIYASWNSEMKDLPLERQVTILLVEIAEQLAAMNKQIAEMRGVEVPKTAIWGVPKQ